MGKQSDKNAEEYIGLLPVYSYTIPEITHPEIGLVTSAYFVHQWFRILSPEASLFIIVLRELIAKRVFKRDLNLAIEALRTNGSRQPIVVTWGELERRLRLDRRVLGRIINKPKTQTFVTKHPLSKAEKAEFGTQGVVKLSVLMVDIILPDDQDGDLSTAVHEDTLIQHLLKVHAVS